VNSAPDETTRTRRFVPARLVAIVWALAIVAVCGRIALNKSPTRQDLFPVYQNAGHSWLAGQDLYRDAKFDYRYSPLFAATVVPISILPLKIGSILWRLIGISVFLGSFYWTSRQGIPDKLVSKETASLFLLLLPLALGNLNNGQANLLVIGVLLASVAAIVRQRWMLAAVCLAVAATIKVYPLALCLLFVLMYPRQLFWRFALCITLAAALPFAMQRTDYVTRQYSDWFHYLQAEDRTSRSISEWYSDLRLILRLWFLALSPRLYLLIQIATGAMIAVLAVVGRLRSWPAQRLLAWTLSLGCCWMLLLGPATESSTYVLVAPTIVWVAAELLVRGGRRLEIAWVALIYGLQLLAGVAGWFGGMKRLGVYTSPLALSALLLAAYLMRPAIFRQMNPQSHRVAAG
jgi:Glycosyltransferase family 87